MGKWNYRVCTWLDWHWVYEGGRRRLFGVKEVHYDANLNPTGWGEARPLSDWEEVDDLKQAHAQVALALEKPVLDLDNHLAEYKPE